MRPLHLQAFDLAMSQMGQKRTKRPAWTLSALLPKADKARLPRFVVFVPKANKAVQQVNSTSVKAGIALMNDRMLGRRWMMFPGQNDCWLEEYRLYRRDGDGS